MSLSFNPGSLFGAGGLLNPDLVAKASNALLVVFHGLTVLAPEAALADFGYKNPTPLHVYVAQRQWSFFLSLSVMGCLYSFHNNMGVNALVGYGAFPIFVDVLRSIASDMQAKTGVRNRGQITILMPSIINTIVCLADVEAAKLITICNGYYSLLRGLLYMVFTKKMNKAWGMEDSVLTPAYESSLKWMGLSIFCYGMSLTGLSMGINFNHIMGYSWTLVALNMARELSAGKEMLNKIGLNKSRFYMWMGMAAVVVPALLSA